jgi:hypothetical protein
MYLAYTIGFLLVCTAIWAAIHWYRSQKSETDCLSNHWKETVTKVAVAMRPASHVLNARVI